MPAIFAARLVAARMSHGSGHGPTQRRHLRIHQRYRSHHDPYACMRIRMPWYLCQRRQLRAIETVIFWRTGMEQEAIEGFGEMTLSRVPIGRFGMLEEVNAVAAFLLPDEASFVTGSVLCRGRRHIRAVVFRPNGTQMLS